MKNVKSIFNNLKGKEPQNQVDSSLSRAMTSDKLPLIQVGANEHSYEYLLKRTDKKGNYRYSEAYQLAEMNERMLKVNTNEKIHRHKIDMAKFNKENNIHISTNVDLTV
jgi:hypothetical protein